MKIAVGMSGGIDSSVAAMLLKEQGHDVIGVTMAIWKGEATDIPEKRHACYGPDEKEDIKDAAAVCKFLGIPFHVLDCADEYEKIVLKYFRNEYLNGRTPNPCVKCNHTMKFGVLPYAVKESGIDFDIFATGHYVRKANDLSSARSLLLKGKDTKKDQSYFLYRLTQKQLKESLFPLGDMLKSDVKQLAKNANLPVADKSESQDFYCGDHKELLGVTDTEGDIVDINGKVLGKHNGTWNFTPGQRKGLGIAAHEPLYVIAVDANSNRVIVGPKSSMKLLSFTVRTPSWISIDKLTEKVECTVKIRYGITEYSARISPIDNGKVNVTLTAPEQIALPPGQSAVFYDGDIVIGGGIIDN